MNWVVAQMIETMEVLRAELETAVSEAYRGQDKVLVHGEGKLSAKVMLIGEAPGEQETRLRRPFVGKAGRNLDEFLEMAGIDRTELYVSNTVKFRPSKISPKGRIVNRPPTRDEIEFFLPWLKREIELVSPGVIVTLGNTPLQALTDRKTVIGEVHGSWLDLCGIRLYPMYHPASIIYNRALKTVYEDDIRRLAKEM